jgi:hypothetical protein
MMATPSVAQYWGGPESYPRGRESYPRGRERSPESYPRPDAYPRGTVDIMCLVDRRYARYRSRPTCELASWQPLGIDCACPSFQSQGQRELPGRVVHRR